MSGGFHMIKLLLVEDEKRMAQALAEFLKLEQYDVTVCYDGIRGCDAILNGSFDVIILDVMLPGKSGFEIAKEVRKANITTPILMLSAKGELDDKVTGLDSGADDYLTKPFLSQELLARLRALCRRNAPAAPALYSFGDLTLNPNTFYLRCERNDQEVRLSEKEFHIMEYFMANQGQVLSREQLALKIWGYENDAEYNNVEVYLSFTRKKLNFIASNVEIKALRGLGYELRLKEC